MKVESRDAIDWVVIAKGIGIFWVVVGHFDPDSSPAYWVAMRRIIYTFHMPLFFFLSGYLYVNGKYSYAALIKNKAQRLLYPFVTIAACYFLIKYAAGFFVHVDYPVDARSVLALLYDPVDSYVPLLWFIHALFLIFVFYPVAKWFLSDLSILLLCLAFEELFGNRFPVIGKALVFLPFFAVGIMFRQTGAPGDVTRPGDVSRPWSNFAAAALIFAAASLLELSGNTDLNFGYVFQCLVGVMGSFIVIHLSGAIAAGADGRLRRALMAMGRYSMTIYLLHPLFVSAVRFGLLRLRQADIPFEIVAVVAIAAGVILPMLLERELLRRFWVTRRFVLGLA